ncbi:MAG: hypothetical protein CME63_01430 [Halobacteriovoraceae bacterium]|nr:hypothetical protein [Halobacteriovoraceae bacterium]
MKWFKHYTNAQTSSSLDDIINEFGFEGYGRYWRLLEFLSLNFDGESTSFRFHNRTLRDCLRFKSKLKLRCYLVAIGLQTGFKVVETKDHFEIEAPILLSLKSRDFKKARPNRDQESPRIEADKDKDKEERREEKKELPTLKQKPLSLVDEYNQQCAIPNNLNSMSHHLTAGQLKNLHSLEGHPELLDEKAWSNYFSRIGKSEFLTKKKKPPVDFAWAIEPENVSKVLMGRYDNNQSTASDFDSVREAFLNG